MKRAVAALLGWWAVCLSIAGAALFVGLHEPERHEEPPLPPPAPQQPARDGWNEPGLPLWFDDVCDFVQGDSRVPDPNPVDAGPSAQLWQEYLRDDTEFDRRYKGKWVKVELGIGATKVVQWRSRRDRGRAVLAEDVADRPDRHSRVYCWFDRPQDIARFRQEENKEEVQVLPKGTGPTVRVVGYCSGPGTASIDLTHCKLLP
jgi:hypothetical protein